MPGASARSTWLVKNEKLYLIYFAKTRYCSWNAAVALTCTSASQHKFCLAKFLWLSSDGGLICSRGSFLRTHRLWWHLRKGHQNTAMKSKIAKFLLVFMTTKNCISKFCDGAANKVSIKWERLHKVASVPVGAKMKNFVKWCCKKNMPECTHYKWLFNRFLCSFSRRNVRLNVGL